MAILPSLLLLASAQVSAAAADPVPAEIFTFEDWAVACDNGLRCQAVSLVPEPQPQAEDAAPAGDPWERFGVLRLEREAGPDAPLSVVLADFEGTPARLVVNDTPLDARISPVGGDADGWRVEPADAKAFFDSLYYGTIIVQDAAGQTISEIALKGLWSALAYMEERQGRLLTQGAVLRHGRRPNSVVPPAPALPVVQVAPRTTERPLAIPDRRLDEARRQFRCTLDEVGVISEQVSTHALGNGRTLILMGCGAGAYNMSSLPLVAWREGSTIRIEPARFDVYHRPIPGEPEPAGYLVTNGEFIDDRMAIGEWSKGRGLGDCGTSSTYAWDGTGFRLVERQEMSECRGTLELLTTWRTERR